MTDKRKMLFWSEADGEAPNGGGGCFMGTIKNECQRKHAGTSLVSGKKLLWLTLIFTLLFAMSAFAATPKLDKTNVTMKVGQKLNSTEHGIILTVKDAKKVTSWYTDDPTVANITPFSGNKKCHVFAIGYGTATITVKADGKTMTCKVTVKDPAPGINASMPFSGYKKLTRVAKGTPNDVIAIAESQRGYTGHNYGSYKSSYFGSKWDTFEMNRHDRDMNGAWCTDFVTWCLFAARVPNTRGLFDIANGYRKDRTICQFYGNKYNSLYRYAPAYAYNRSSIDSFLRGYKVRGTLNASTIRRGDICVVNRGHHTTLVKNVNRSNGAVQVVEGNCGNQVRTDRWISASEIFAVARPAYNY